MRVLIALTALVALSLFVAVEARTLAENDYQKQFTSFVKKYNKNYAHDEFFPRYNTFKANFDLIRTHNMGNHSYSMGVNEFTDLTFSEFHARYTGYVPRPTGLLGRTFAERNPSFTAPASVDWRAKNAVTPVKNQAQCGSCWAFSATGAMEGAYAVKTGQLLSFSEQQLVDCSTGMGNMGCNGGLMDNAFRWVIQNKGICAESDYTYTATGPNACQTTCKNVASFSSYKDVTPGSEDALAEAVAQGPVSVAIEADQQAFQFYSGGVLTEACGTNLDHGVLTVGYGHDDVKGVDFWILKNSWGNTWGEAGYIRIQRGINQCGVAAAASYPVV